MENQEKNYNFKSGDIVTYDGWPNTIAMFGADAGFNDSGDRVYSPVVAVCDINTKEPRIYLGQMCYDDDIRLANRDECVKFYDKLNNLIAKLKQELLNLKYTSSETDAE